MLSDTNTCPCFYDVFCFAVSTKEISAVSLALANLWHLLVQQDPLPSSDLLTNLVPGATNALASLAALSATSRALLVSHIVRTLGDPEEQRTAEQNALLRSMQPHLLRPILATM